MQRQLSLLGNVLKSNGSRFPRPNQGFLPSLRQLPRNLSTDVGTESKEPSSDPFLQPPTKGLIYGRLTGIGKNTLKTDVIHFFEGCGLTTQDTKVDYNRTYASLGMILQFSSRTDFDFATRLITRKGRLYRLEKVDRGQWDLLKFYDGKVDPRQHARAVACVASGFVVLAEERNNRIFQNLLCRRSRFLRGPSSQSWNGLIVFLLPSIRSGI